MKVKTTNNSRKLQRLQKRLQIKGAKKHFRSHQIILLQKSKKIATYTFVDKIKSETITSLKHFSSQNIKLHIFTGDTKEKTKQITDKFSFPVVVHADCTPKSKQAGIKEIKKKYSVAMVGDGINDAPDLALADVGLDFSQNQQTASTEAADIVLVGSNFDQVLDSVKIAKNTLKIAKQSMYAGVTLSLLGMIFAFLGLLNPLSGSLTQEIIDVAVILNALRAIKPPKPIH
jgi:P-type E1-E2 ATPase